ncbi:MAG TPA: flagellar biosynthetic protein FliO [Thiolapillus brandeum]|uniref:Flagellar protein n=1 Tax=Thiolapillus brandeum TaxID=1076588 RepID=A0A831RXA8_9GAMM|nr:flagellar biosynthetic protein FliO [Thiolapillus brandeum]
MISLHSRMLLSLLLIAPVAGSATAADPLSGTSLRTDLGAQLVQVLGGLGVVLAMVLLLAWLTKRFSQSRLSGAHGLRLLGGISLGAKERIVLVQAGDVQLLVGVAPGRLQTLHVLEEPIQLQDSKEAADDEGFGQKLGKLLEQTRGKE